MTSYTFKVPLNKKWAQRCWEFSDLWQSLWIATHWASAPENYLDVLMSRQRWGKSRSKLRKGSLGIFKFSEQQWLCSLSRFHHQSSPSLISSHGDLENWSIEWSRVKWLQKKKKKGQGEASGLAQGLMLNQLQNREQKFLGSAFTLTVGSIVWEVGQ